MTPEQIKDELRNFTGTEHYYKHPFGIYLTDGVMFLCEECKCRWLVDLIASYQFYEKVKLEEFQVYKLSVNKDNSALVKIENGDCVEIARQDIEYTDFPLEYFEIWFANRVAYLPSEH